MALALNSFALVDTGMDADANIQHNCGCGRSREMGRPDLLCIGCDKTPAELQEYVDAADEEASGDPNMTPDEYVWQEEGTLNRENGHFLCTDCYIKAGMPTSPRGWTAP